MSGRSSGGRIESGRGGGMESEEILGAWSPWKSSPMTMGSWGRDLIEMMPLSAKERLSSIGSQVKEADSSIENLPVLVRTNVQFFSRTSPNIPDSISLSSLAGSPSRDSRKMWRWPHMTSMKSSPMMKRCDDPKKRSGT
ncbi:hypothetical protein PFISCL1PPCAC_7075 [Pristionchus fissidentatus]|uniref:BLOC-1-related complex subunit 7 n=1 Tax=Pristionchus fissidentatus TaxID=1538716 RepID=A0AAV5VC35_9BILA|nr:hypothetical protein PFISCL1PPCAC_7075 [Pristionchus fissidentatus]